MTFPGKSGMPSTADPTHLVTQDTAAVVDMPRGISSEQARDLASVE